LTEVATPATTEAGRVLANFGRVVKGGELRLHPLVAGLVDEETLKGLGAGRMAQSEESGPTPVRPQN
jgi:hypothetical protein